MDNCIFQTFRNNYCPHILKSETHNVQAVEELNNNNKKVTFVFVIESGGVGELTAMIIAVVRCHSTVHELAICYNKENEDNIKEGIKASVPASAKISCVSHHNPFLKKREKALCLQLTADTEMVVSQ